MEVSGVDSISDTRCGSPLKHCIDLCSLLAEKGMEFTISVKIDNSFEFKLKSQNSEAPRVKKRSPSYLRRQERRKFLKKKLVSSPAESMNTREESGANKCSTPEDLSDNYIRDEHGYIIGYLPSEDNSDTNNISLDLSPNLTRHPGCAAVSEGSIESEPDEAGKEPGGEGDGADADGGWMLASPKSHRRIRREKRS